MDLRFSLVVLTCRGSYSLYAACDRVSQECIALFYWVTSHKDIILAVSSFNAKVFLLLLSVKNIDFYLLVFLKLRFVIYFRNIFVFVENL